MQIAKDSVVTFHYRLSVDGGATIEDSHGNEPMTYLQGHGNIIPGLESAMLGKAAGDTFTATIPPEEAYGIRNPQGLVRVPMKHVLTKGKLAPGMMIAVNTGQGARHVQVIKPGKFVVDVDTNHPLAGATLTFEIEVVAVREALAEEIAHRHVHGDGGHHH